MLQCRHKRVGGSEVGDSSFGLHMTSAQKRSATASLSDCCLCLSPTRDSSPPRTTSAHEFPRNPLLDATTCNHLSRRNGSSFLSTLFVGARQTEPATRPRKPCPKR